MAYYNFSWTGQDVDHQIPVLLEVSARPRDACFLIYPCTDLPMHRDGRTDIICTSNLGGSRSRVSFLAPSAALGRLISCPLPGFLAFANLYRFMKFKWKYGETDLKEGDLKYYLDHLNSLRFYIAVT